MHGITTGVTRIAGDGLDVVLKTFFTKTGAAPLKGSYIEAAGDIVLRPMLGRSTYAMIPAGADDLDGLAPMLQLRGDLPAEIGNLVTSTGRARNVSIEGWLNVMEAPRSTRMVAALDVARVTDPRFQTAHQQAARSVDELFGGAYVNDIEALLRR